MSSMSSLYTGKRDRPEDWMVDKMVLSSALRGSVTISVRWIITSSAVMLLNSKMFSMSSFSFCSMAPDSSPSSTMAMISLASSSPLSRCSQERMGRRSRSSRLSTTLIPSRMGHIWSPDTEIPPYVSQQDRILK